MRDTPSPATLALLTVAALFLAAGECGAADSAITGEDEGGKVSLKAKDWNLSLTGGAMIEHKDDLLIRYGAAAFEYFFFDDVSGKVEILRYDANQEPGGTSDGLGLNLLANVYFLKTRRSACFVSGGLGLARFSRRMPQPMGTHFNFTTNLSFGARLLLSENMHFLAAAKYMHLSNADIDGEERNPAFDGFGGYGGLTVGF